MKFSLKSIASAVVLAVAASGASAAIDIGASGNGELFLNVWNADTSYSFDLNKQVNAFESDIAAAGNINQSYALNGFSSFLASVADTSTLKFNLVGVDASGARRLLTTFTAPAPAATKQNDVIRSAVGNISGFASVVSTAMGANDYSIVGSSSVAYAGKPAMGKDIGTFLNFNTTGNLANNNYSTGLSFMRIDALATGIALSKVNPYVESDGSAVKVWIDGTNLNIAAAVPEPESYAMLLAGLGMIGLIARRNKRA